jgi:hypothetical protein
LVHDEAVGFELITTDDFDEMGPEGIVKVIRDRVGNDPVYLRYVEDREISLEDHSLSDPVLISIPLILALLLRVECDLIFL